MNVFLLSFLFQYCILSQFNKMVFMQEIASCLAIFIAKVNLKYLSIQSFYHWEQLRSSVNTKFALIKTPEIIGEGSLN